MRERDRERERERKREREWERDCECERDHRWMGTYVPLLSICLSEFLWHCLLCSVDVTCSKRVANGYKKMDLS